MIQLLDDGILQIILYKHNKCKILKCIVDMEQTFPDRDSIENYKKIFEATYDTFKESTIMFYHLFIFKNVGVRCIIGLSDVLSEMIDFFKQFKDVFENYLECNIVLIDNIILRNALNLALVTYKPVKEIYFIKEENEIDNYIN